MRVTGQRLAFQALDPGQEGLKRDAMDSDGIHSNSLYCYFNYNWGVTPFKSSVRDVCRNNHGWCSRVGKNVINTTSSLLLEVIVSTVKRVRAVA